MPTRQVSDVIQHLRRTVLLQDGAGLTDGQLLEGYLSRRDEAALAALVRRHAPMVWGVCRRLLGHHDAEDAFQATFLVLVRKAASIASRELLANWLYGVARQTALKARATLAKRKGRERQVAVMPEPAVAGPDLWNDLLDQELSRLPVKYRAVIVLCYLEGKTRQEAARQLGVPPGTVASRLATAKAVLAKRLARHGLAVSVGALAAVLSQEVASACVPPSLVSSTIKAAGLFAAGQAASAQVVALTEGVLKAMLLTRLKLATAVVFVMTLICGAGILASHAQDRKQDAAAPKQAKEDDDKLKDTLLALDTKYWAAWTKGKGDGDVKVVYTLLAEDYLCIWGDDPPIDKAAAFEGIKHYRYSERAIRDVEVRRISKDAAVLTYACSIKLSVDDQEPVSVDYRGSCVWARRDGGWVLVFQHAHPLKPNEQQALPSPFGK